MTALKQKILNKTAKLGIIGLGYVGLPLALEFVKSGFKVIGVDIDQQRVEMFNKGESYISDVDSEELKPFVDKDALWATADYSCLENLDTVSICVPTPLNKTRDPDLSFIVAAVTEIAKYLRNNQLVILESTTYPGTTRELILPMLEGTGLKVGTDFFLAFSPERIDPGNKTFTTRNIPKVVGGITLECTEIAKTLYEQVIETVIPVSSTDVAEMVKLLENTFRSVNIGLVNEIALMSDKLGIDVWEVIDAAATKPFGFMPFYPGPGLGGHCLPVDPFYLSWKARQNGFEARFIELAGQVNAYMPVYVVQKITDALNERSKSVKGSKILILGVAYKKDVNDTRESPALDIIEILRKKGASVLYSDPYVPQLIADDYNIVSQELREELLKNIDCVVIVTNHSEFDYQYIVSHAPLVVDTRNATKGMNAGKEKVVKI
jgi:UDP-N-acetyl-D-glucosamine dehydrogenase